VKGGKLYNDIGKTQTKEGENRKKERPGMNRIRNAMQEKEIGEKGG